MRIIKSVIKPQKTTDGAGVNLKRVIGTNRINHVDPFLLLDHFGSENPEDYIAGFPMHPHRGIETVTYMLSGKVEHKDSIGNAGSVEAGDVQWMTSGKGILHEEMPKVVDARLNGFQLWVNMPAKLKMSEPRYQEVEAKKIPVVNGDGYEMKIIAGKFDGVKGAVEDIYIKPTFFDFHMEPDNRLQIPIEDGYNVFIYQYEGEAEYDETTGSVSDERLIILKGEGEISVKTYGNGARFLVVAGQPLNEPIARYGPFVMNTQDEIQQTLSELRNGTFPPK